MALIGMDRRTGKPITGVEHLKQSIWDILTTRKGSRRERPEYGSDLPLLVDKPMTAGLKAVMQSESARAIDRWEPRIKVKSCRLVSATDGRFMFEIKGDYLGDSVVLEVST